MNKRTEEEWQHDLKKGLLKEAFMEQLLTSSNITYQKNNEEDIYAIDFFLPDARIYLECKYAATPYGPPKGNDIAYGDSLPLNMYHIQRYKEVQENEGIPVIIGFIVDFERYNVSEQRFFILDDIFRSITIHKNRVWKDKDDVVKLAIDRKNGILLPEFARRMTDRANKYLLQGAEI